MKQIYTDIETAYTYRHTHMHTRHIFTDKQHIHIDRQQHEICMTTLCWSIQTCQNNNTCNLQKWSYLQKNSSWAIKHPNFHSSRVRSMLQSNTSPVHPLLIKFFDAAYILYTLVELTSALTSTKHNKLMQPHQTLYQQQIPNVKINSYLSQFDTIPTGIIHSRSSWHRKPAQWA